MEKKKRIIRRTKLKRKVYVDFVNVECLDYTSIAIALSKVILMKGGIKGKKYGDLKQSITN